MATYEVEGWRYAGKVGSGIDEPTRKLLRQILDEHLLDRPPIVGVSHLKEAHWSEPRIVIRAEFAEWTVDGLLRQASFKGREVGRDPTSVTREKVEHADDIRDQASLDASTAAPAGVERCGAHAHDRRRTRRPLRSGARAGAGGTDPGGARRDGVDGRGTRGTRGTGQTGAWEVGGHTVKLTNLDKVIFPGARLTKRDLVRYYSTIAPAILPYLRDRPLNVHRWPDGVTGKTQFWQKQIPSHAPEWVARWDYPDAGREQSHTYVVADRVATMAWLANQAVIDLHPWTSRLPEYWRPTYAYIDIDPGEKTTWQEVLTLARLYRTALTHLGVRGYPKVTGKRGIQIWIAIEPRYTFDNTRDWVGGLVTRRRRGRAGARFLGMGQGRS